MSSNHIRAISVTLSLLDKDLYSFDQWGKGHEVSSVLYEVRNTLSGVQRQVVAERVARMHTALKGIRDTLNLDGAIHEVHKMILGSCAVQWASLVELESSRLRRYGEVPPGLGQYLDPEIRVLSQELRGISKIAGEVGRGGSD
jgi:hypothetical protein